nr:uncharacterized protein CFP56_46600 [Quercus suber]
MTSDLHNMAVQLRLYVASDVPASSTSPGPYISDAVHSMLMATAEAQIPSIMATLSSESGPSTKEPRQSPRALADLHLNTLIAAQEQATSSEDEAADGIEGIEANDVVGVSIGKEQTRLTSPRTPAIEKAAAIESAGGFFPPSVPEFGEEQEDPENELQQRSRAGDASQEKDPWENVTRKQDVRLSSLWRMGDVDGAQYRDKTSSIGGAASRDRASTSESTFEGLQRAFMANLPSLPKNFPKSSPFPSHDNESTSKRQKRGSLSQWISTDGGSDRIEFTSRFRSGSGSRKLKIETHPDEIPEAEPRSEYPARPQLQRTRSRVSELRRSASDTSLDAHRTLSYASSLGDDTRFENVQDQVNSRFKAIKDSLQDSSIKLPSLPSIPSFSNLKPDFLRGNSGSSGQKQGMPPEKPQDPMTRQPYGSAKAAARDTTTDKVASHPHLHSAMDHLEGDLVILGGYRGSILRSAEPPHRQVWVPVKVGLNLRKVDLEVGLDEQDDERATQKIIPGGMLTHIGPVDISRRLFKRLRGCDNARSGRLRVHDYGYDWRLDPLYLSKRLIRYLENLPCNQLNVPKDRRGATVIAHSLGGLITRHAVNQRPDLFRGVVYAGVPHNCINILGPLRNGDDVLLSSRVLTAQVNFTIRTSFALLPLDGRCFFDKNTKEEYRVDFFDPKTWIEYRLSPCVARPLPPLISQPKPSGISGYVSSMASVLPSFPGRKSSLRSESPSRASPMQPLTPRSESGVESNPFSPDMHTSDSVVANNNMDQSAFGAKGRNQTTDTSTSVSTAVSIPFPQAFAYLARTLASVKRFKEELAHVPAHTSTNVYPPIAVIYGKSTPTVFGAKVDGREGIKHADAYDELAFASGDGVVLARAAMVPDGYSTVKGGVVSSERGHVTLLGDLEAVGKSLNAVIAGRRRGIGSGQGEG